MVAVAVGISRMFASWPPRAQAASRVRGSRIGPSWLWFPDTTSNDVGGQVHARDESGTPTTRGSPTCISPQAQRGPAALGSVQIGRPGSSASPRVAGRRPLVGEMRPGEEAGPVVRRSLARGKALVRPLGHLSVYDVGPARRRQVRSAPVAVGKASAPDASRGRYSIREAFRSTTAIGPLALRLRYQRPFDAHGLPRGAWLGSTAPIRPGEHPGIRLTPLHPLPRVRRRLACAPRRRGSSDY